MLTAHSFFDKGINLKFNSYDVAWDFIKNNDSYTSDEN